MRTNLDEEFINFILSIPIGGSKEAYPEAKKKFKYSSKLSSFKKLVSRTRVANKNDEKGIKTEAKPNPRGKVKLVGSDLLTILKMRGHMRTLELCSLFSCSPKKIQEMIAEEQKKGTEIVDDDEFVFLSDGSIANKPEQIVNPLSNSKEVIFGVASDLHFGSRECQITALNSFCDDCKKEGIKYILVPGDCLAGIKVYRGQEREQYAFTADEQEASLLRNLPEGFTWLVMGGNHDYSFIKNGGGHNPFPVISNSRKDIHFLGYDEVTIPILNGVDLKMWHPGGAGAYALSYKVQKYIEQNAYKELVSISSGNKPRPTLRFVLAGHYHLQFQAKFGSIFGCYPGCFEGATKLSITRGWIPNIGGYIIRAWLHKDGTFDHFIADFREKKEIREDWKNYRHSYDNGKEEVIEKPLFDW